MDHGLSIGTDAVYEVCGSGFAGRPESPLPVVAPAGVGAVVGLPLGKGGRRRPTGTPRLANTVVQVPVRSARPDTVDRLEVGAGGDAVGQETTKVVVAQRKERMNSNTSSAIAKPPRWLSPGRRMSSAAVVGKGDSSPQTRYGRL